VPTNLRIYDDRAKRLEFYLQIYFYIYNIHPLINPNKKKISKDSIENFKTYLDTRGSDLSKTSEFLHYYALPYINKPHEHAAIKHLFTQEWISNL
jgi:LisH domain-containing protein ARMC9